jgi:PAS domain S-box-containing protein
MDDNEKREEQILKDLAKLRCEVGILDVLENEQQRIKREVELLYHWKEQLLGPGSLGKKLTIITDKLGEVFDADFARIWIIKESDLCAKGCRHAMITEGPEACRNRIRCLHLMASSGRYPSVDGSHRRIPLDCCKIGHFSFDEDVQYITNDVLHDPHIHDHAWAESLGLVSFAGYRILSPEGKPLGVLAFFSRKAIDRSEEVLLEDLAHTASQVIRAGMAEEALRESENVVRQKLDAMLSPDTDFGALELSDVIDCGMLQKLMDQFYQLTHIGIGIIDLKGKVLVGTGWQDICTNFHRKNPESCALCIESDLELSRNVSEGTFKLYRCKNNMWDITTPIFLGKQHVGNIFLGQFLFDDEVPNLETFRLQARRYGFDEQEYLAALDRVPRWSRETVDAAMSFYTALAGMIGNLSYSNIKLANALEERKRIEEALREAERKLRTLVDNIPNFIARFDSDCRFIFVNPTVLKTFGQQSEDVIGKTLCEIGPAGYHAENERLQNAIKQTFASGEPNSMEAKWLTPQGERYYDILHVPEKDENGTVVSVMAISHDITAYKQANENIALLSFALNNVREAAFLIDEKRHFHFVNEESCRVLGYNRQELLTMSVSDIDPNFPPERRSNHWDEFKKRRSLSIESHHKTKDGRIFPVEVNANYIEYGGKAYNLALVHDITERKRAEEERQAHARFLENLDRINLAIQRSNNLEQMVNDVLDTVLSIFDCDRAWLVYPCDPEATTWRAPMERNRPEYPGALTLGLEVPMDPDVVRVFRTVLSSSGPVQFGPGFEHPLPAQVAKQFNEQSQIAMAIYPKGDKPSMFGLHQCSYPRIWTPDEEKLLQEIGRRLTDGLTGVLAYRNLEMRVQERTNELTKIVEQLHKEVRERTRAEEELQQERRTLEHLLRSSDHERQLIAYEIHDGLAQELAGAIMQFHSYAHLKKSNPRLSKTAFQAGMTMLNKSHQEVRQLISGVRPPILDESGIVDAITHLVNDQSREKTPEIEFHYEVGFERLDSILENSIYRIVQEGLANACKHSNSKKVRIELEEHDQHLYIKIQDWGIGFDPENVKETCYGLAGIRERVRLLDGKVIINSAPKKGTLIAVELPLVE